MIDKDIEKYEHIGTFMLLYNLEPTAKSPGELGCHLVEIDRTTQKTEFHCKIYNGVSLNGLRKFTVLKIDEINSDSL